MGAIFQLCGLHKHLLMFVLAGSMVALSLDEVHAEGAGEAPQPGKLEQAVARMVALRISNLHISRKDLGDEVGREAFNEYFDQLDSSRYYFLRRDIEEFSSYKSVLDDLVKEGKVDFVYDVYERFLKRVRERVAYVKKRLQEPFEFQSEARLEVDRKNAAWVDTRKELNKLWDKRLKNELLRYKLMQSGHTAEKASGGTSKKTDRKDSSEGQDSAGAETGEDRRIDVGEAKEKNTKKKTEKSLSDKTEEEDSGEVREGEIKISRDIFSEKTPEERVRESYERYLRRVRSRTSLEVLEIFLTSLTHIYGPHSAYMAPETEEEFNIQMNLSLQGIGAELTTENGYVKVVDIIPGGPAAEDGRLNPGDRIIGVAEKEKETVDVVDMPLRKVVDMIRGKKGTKVYLTVVQAEKGMGSVPVVIGLTRDEVKLKQRAAKAELLQVPKSNRLFIDTSAPANRSAQKTVKKDGTSSSQILVIRLPAFYRDFKARKEGEKDFKSSTRDVKRILKKYTNERQIDGVVLDIRSNGGGSLEEAIGVAGLFIPDGPVVQVKYANGKKRVLKDKNSDVFFDQPLVVMTNRLSASASEIVSGAIKDYGRGVVLGAEKTHGKGTVQSVYHLKKAFKHAPGFKEDVRPGSLKFTMAKFYRINGSSTQRKGVSPHIVFPSYRREMELGESSLPHALAWDRIEPVEADSDAISKITVAPYLKKLKKRSRQRRELSSAYKSWMKLVRKMGQQHKHDTISLSLEERKDQQKRKEKLSSEIKRYTRQRSALSDDISGAGEGEGQNDSEKGIDLVLREALHVARDLVRLSQGQELQSLSKGSDAPATIYVSKTTQDGHPEK